MITVAIKDNGEKSVIQMTYEHLWRELQDIPGAEILVVDNWYEALTHTKNGFICFVESDCLVSGGFFNSQVGKLKKDNTLRKLGVLGTATGVLNWANRIYGYSFGNNYSDGIIPNRTAISRVIYPIQIAYIPGAIIRTDMLKEVLSDKLFPPSDNLVEFSVALSAFFWNSGTGHRIALNPNTTYVTTEKYPADIARVDVDSSDLLATFTKAGIR